MLYHRNAASFTYTRPPHTPVFNFSDCFPLLCSRPRRPWPRLPRAASLDDPRGVRVPSSPVSYDDVVVQSKGPLGFAPVAASGPPEPRRQLKDAQYLLLFISHVIILMFVGSFRTDAPRGVRADPVAPPACPPSRPRLTQLDSSITIILRMNFCSR